MKKCNNRRFDRATRVQTFGKENAADLADGSKAKTHFANLDGIILDLLQAKADQTPKRVSKEVLLEALRLDLKNIARTARRIEQQVHGFSAPYRLPDTPGGATLATHADAVLARLEDQPDEDAEAQGAKAAVRARFVEYELPPDFVARLRADRQAIADITQFNQGETQYGVENTERIDQVLGKAQFEIAELDAIMHNKYTRQPEKLRAWQSASHLERAPRHEKSTLATPPVPAPVPTPALTATPNA
jgi:hypothetical protein